MKPKLDVAVHYTVFSAFDALKETLHGFAGDETEYDALAVNRAVVDALDWAVWWAVTFPPGWSEYLEPDHPGLEDFIFSEEESPDGWHK